MNLIKVDTYQAANNVILVELTFPGRKAAEHATVRNLGDVERLCYFHTRGYIVDKLQAWLRQRHHALRQAGAGEKLATVSKLIVQFGYYQQASLPAIARVIRENRQPISSIAPGEQSRFYNYYCEVIVPVLLYCERELK